MKYEFDIIVHNKLAHYAESLSEEIDFIDYWINFCKSSVFREIESNWFARINAFHWTRWREDFELIYEPIKGNGYSEKERWWYASFMHYLQYAMQSPSASIVDYYGKEVLFSLMDEWYQYHTFGVDCAIEKFIEKHNKPIWVKNILRLQM